MALNIKDPRTDRLARELAEATGESITDAVRRGIEERLTRVRAAATLASNPDDLADLIARGRKRRLLDDRSADDIIGYDDRGLPR